MFTIPPEQQPEFLAEKNTSLIQLASNLWLDLDGGTIIRQQQVLLLTARETQVLRILAHALRNGRQYLSAQVIAERINLSAASDPEHSIEQTISQIRHKLGEEAHHPHILYGRRGFGYRLFPKLT